jgi:hypothetical protein
MPSGHHPVHICWGGHRRAYGLLCLIGGQQAPRCGIRGPVGISGVGPRASLVCLATMMMVVVSATAGLANLLVRLPLAATLGCQESLEAFDVERIRPMRW